MRMRGCTTSGKHRLMWIPSYKPLCPLVHGPVEDEVDTYEALVGGRVSELSIEQSRGYVCIRANQSITRLTHAHVWSKENLSQVRG